MNRVLRRDVAPAHAAVVLLATILLSPTVVAQPTAASTAAEAGSRNMELVAHLPMGTAPSQTAGTGFENLSRNTGDLVFEQTPDRPYVHVVHRDTEPGFSSVNLSDPHAPSVAMRYRLDGGGQATDITVFRLDGRPYVALGVMRPAGGAGSGGLRVVDVAGQSARVVGSVSADPGYHHLFAYRHSNGSGYVFATGGGAIDVYLTEDLVAGSAEPVASISIPAEVPNVDYGYHAMHAAWHAETETDRLYTAGAGGYHVFDISDVQNPEPLATVTSAAVQIGHSISPTPDGTHIVTSAGYRASPLRIFDLRPVLDGTVSEIRTAAGAWTADWRNYSENHELRWPYVFTASFEDGLQVFNMMNPFEPYTAGFYDTWDGQRSSVSNEKTHRTGAWDVDVRNSDGLIAVADAITGLWLFRMEEFKHWDGRGWGLPNVSSVQDWERGPTGATEWTTE